MHPPRRVLFGKNVNRLRTVLGWTQEGLAERAGIDRSYLQRIEAGRVAPGLEVICQLCEAFAVSVDELMCGVVALPGVGRNGDGAHIQRLELSPKGLSLGRVGAGANGSRGHSEARRGR